MAPTPETLRFERRLAQVGIDWREAAVSARANTAHKERSYRTARREELAVGYRLGELLWEDDVEWASFQEEKLWNGRPLDRENALRYGIQYVAGEAKGPLAELASSHANALEAAFHSTPPVPASAIPAYIEENGGIGALLQAYRDHRKTSASPGGGTGNTGQSKAKGTAVTEHVSGDAEAGQESAGPPGQQEDLGRNSSATAAPNSPPTVDYPGGVEEWVKLEVLIRPADFDFIMNLDVEALVKLDIKRAANGDAKRKRIEGWLVD